MTAETRFHTDTSEGGESIDRTSLVITLLFAVAIVLVNLSIFMVFWTQARHNAPAALGQTSLSQTEPATRLSAGPSAPGVPASAERARTQPAPPAAAPGERQEARVDPASLAENAGPAGLGPTPRP